MNDIKNKNHYWLLCTEAMKIISEYFKQFYVSQFTNIYAVHNLYEIQTTNLHQHEIYRLNIFKFIKETEFIVHLLKIFL